MLLFPTSAWTSLLALLAGLVSEIAFFLEDGPPRAKYNPRCSATTLFSFLYIMFSSTPSGNTQDPSSGQHLSSHGR